MEQVNRYFLELSYKGRDYHGWQTQPNAVTVQETLDKALAILFRQPVETLGCGRTDTGVHARQFFAHFDLEEPVSPNARAKLAAQLNALLPADIAVSRLLPVHPSAHARFDATSREYTYHLHFRKDPFKTDSSWLVRNVPDTALMNEAAAGLLGRHDFSCFSKSHTQVFTNICEVSKAEWTTSVNEMTFVIAADRFLRNMVRAIVGTLVSIGHGQLPVTAMQSIMDSGQRSKAGASAPACGLYLSSVIYPYITQQIQDQWQK